MQEQYERAHSALEAWSAQKVCVEFPDIFKAWDNIILEAYDLAIDSHVLGVLNTARQEVANHIVKIVNEDIYEEGVSLNLWEVYLKTFEDNM